MPQVMFERRIARRVLFSGTQISNYCPTCDWSGVSTLVDQSEGKTDLHPPSMSAQAYAGVAGGTPLMQAQQMQAQQMQALQYAQNGGSQQMANSVAVHYRAVPVCPCLPVLKCAVCLFIAFRHTSLSLCCRPSSTRSPLRCRPSSTRRYTFFQYLCAPVSRAQVRCVERYSVLCLMIAFRHTWAFSVYYERLCIAGFCFSLGSLILSYQGP
jgi:hypothetical protein